ncbi:MAG: ABC transporter ATP-binding protein [Lachnospiraceae bacterium]|nr:ABC transporter ATP-binding protein [Lachnospiraceae bacterium]
MLKVDKISKAFCGREIFNDVSFTVDMGTRIGLFGPSGCGKTTILRIIAGLEKADGGEIIIDDVVMKDTMAPYERNASMVFQDPTLWNHMKVKDNIAYGMSVNDREYVNDLALRLGIEDILDKFPEQISGGQAKRVALARALAADKKYILLDEPLSNIDEETKVKILDFLKNEKLTGKGLIYVSHSEAELKALGCDILRL